MGMGSLPERRGAAGLCPAVSSGDGCVFLAELRSHPMGRSHGSVPKRSAVLVALAAPHHLPLSTHLGPFCCWRWKMQKAVMDIMLFQNPSVLIQSFRVQAFPCISWLRSPFVVMCYHVRIGGFVLLTENVKGRTENVFLGDAPRTRCSLPTRYLSTPTPLALVFGSSSPVGWNFGVCFNRQISQHKWLHLGEKAWLSA